jgi:hypothetical protein
MRIFLILLLASLAGCADEARKAREADQQREIAVAELTARGTAQSLATASLLGGYKDARRSQALIDRAVAIAPDQPALAYVQWRECAEAATCAEEEEIRARLQAVAPDNGLVWSSELNAAWERADAPAVTRAVAKIGASRHISIYWNSLIVMMVDAFGEKSRSTGRPVFAESPTDRMIYAAGILAARSIPPLQAMAKSCRADQFDQHGRREACEAMMARLADSDNFLMQSLAVSIQQKWWTEGSLEREQLRARRRQLDYLMLASSRVRVLHLDRDSARRLEAMRESNHELDVMRAMLAFHHEPLEPPANWKDPRAPRE